MKINKEEVEETINKVEKYDKITDIIILGEAGANVRMRFHYKEEEEDKNDNR